MKRNPSKFTIEQRAKIVHEYETTNLSLPELCQKYGIKSISCITNWRASLRKSTKSISFASGSIPKDACEPFMQEKTITEIEAELAQTKKELEWARLQNLALNTMIDIAEEQGIRIRKKSGAKR